jgi:hypothetical protein
VVPEVGIGFINFECKNPKPLCGKITSHHNTSQHNITK